MSKRKSYTTAEATTEILRMIEESSDESDSDEDLEDLYGNDLENLCEG